ncbi:uncharacterized membrane-anchored protein YhcB (DUF1043 family) [Neisseria sp. HSC-16F19]|nr:DUF1043 family protein [Neisseria sp. HSC-16F19]MCP2040307.1 uncharacterized membrane-anchored protein YhcB (DUF1043 family) [Neisseria sp. HSC-16F19]
MDPVAQLVLAALGGFVLGLLVMWLVKRSSSGKQQQQHDALQQQFSDYRRHVDQHFVDTAAAVDELNRSYQKVVQHLSQGAQSLMGKEALQEQLSKRTDASVTVAYLAAQAAVADETAAENAAAEALEAAEHTADAADASVETVETAAAAETPTVDLAPDLPPPPPYTDATEAEVVPLHGQPDRVPDRIGDAVAGAETVAPAEPVEPEPLNANEPADLHKPKV